MTATMNFEELKHQVRADRHATSYPLVVVAAAAFHYIAAGFPGWIPFTYGMPLAFVVLWGLQRRNERDSGVGSGNDDVLIAAFVVFLGTSLVASENFITAMRTVNDGFNNIIPGVFLLPSALGLGFIAYRQHNRVLGIWSTVLVGALLISMALEPSVGFDFRNAYFEAESVLMQAVLVAILIVGLAQYRRESATDRD